MKNCLQFAPTALSIFSATYANKPHGAFAELVQNSLQAHATKCTINTITTTNPMNNVPSKMLYVLDDGHGMSLPEVKQLINIGHVNTQSEKYLLGYKGFGFKTAIFALCNDALIVTRKHDNCTSFTSFSMSHNVNDKRFKTPTVTFVNYEWKGDAASFHLIAKHFNLGQDGLLNLCSKITSATGTMIVMHNLKPTIKLDEANHDIVFPKSSSEDAQVTTKLGLYCKFMYFSRRMKIELFNNEIMPFDYTVYTNKAQVIEENKVQFHFATVHASALQGCFGFNLYTSDGKSVYCFEKCSSNMRHGVLAYATLNNKVEINKLEFVESKQVLKMMFAAYEKYIALYPAETHTAKKVVQLPRSIVKQSAVSAKRPRSSDEEEEEIVVFSKFKKPRLE